MRFGKFALAMVLLCGPAMAQVAPQIEYTNIPDRFRALFPAQPKVEDVMFTTLNATSGEDLVMKARRHTAVWNGGTYSVTAIDFAPYFEPHNTTIQSAMAHAATTIREMGKVTYDGYQRTDRIPGHLLYVTLPSGERLYTLIVLHQETVQGTRQAMTDKAERRMYIAQARLPADERPPSLFLTSLQVVEPNGVRIRYEPNGVWKLPAGAAAGAEN